AQIVRSTRNPLSRHRSQSPQMHSSSNNRRCLVLRDRMSTGRITMIHEQETKRAAAPRQTSVRCGACGKDTNGRRPSAPNIPSSNSGETQRKQSAASRLPELPRAQPETTDAKILSSWMYSSCGFGSAGLYQTGGCRREWEHDGRDVGNLSSVLLCCMMNSVPRVREEVCFHAHETSRVHCFRRSTVLRPDVWRDHRRRDRPGRRRGGGRRGNRLE